MEMQTVYKKDSKGKTRVLQVYADGPNLIKRSGLLGGSLVEHIKKCKPKNVGRSNETTASEQASKEASANIIKKLQEGYFKTVEEAKNNTLILPMLAKEYGKESHKINWENDDVYIQRKYDGVRCISTPGKPNSLVSRKNRPIDTMGHIARVVEKLNFPYSLDGELYVPGLSFQEVTRLVKKYRLGESENVKYYIYDIVAPELSFTERNKMLEDLFGEFISDHLVEVLTYSTMSEKHMQSFHKDFVNTGYEGTMIRLGNSKYKIAGRSSGLLKYKDFQDINVIIKDVIPMDARPSQGIFLCELPDGRTFKATPKCSVTQKEAILNNRQKLQGTEVEIRFFELTDDGIPRFPVAIVDLDK